MVYLSLIQQMSYEMKESLCHEKIETSRIVGCAIHPL